MGAGVVRAGENRLLTPNPADLRLGAATIAAVVHGKSVVDDLFVQRLDGHRVPPPIPFILPREKQGSSELLPVLVDSSSDGRHNTFIPFARA